MKAQTNNTRKTQAHKKTMGESLNGRLAALPAASGAHLDELLAHSSDNPFLKMVRWFFFYSEESGHSETVPRARAAEAHLHGKSLAH